MKHNFLTIAIIGTMATALLVSCSKELNRQPPNTVTASQAFSTDTGAKQALAQVYSSFALTSPTGPSNTDLVGIDAGTSDFVRLLWDASELSTDEAVCAWNDPGVPDFHNMAWTSGNVILQGLYTRIMYQVTVANAFIKNAEAVQKSFSGQDAKDIGYYIAEARFIRALDYWEMLDLYGTAPFVTETSPIGVGSFLPPQASTARLYAYVQSELLSLDSASAMVPAHQNEYGRADQACVWALLARLYLNSGTYLGASSADYTDAITYSSKVIGAGYKLHPVYHQLFMADNNTNNPEIIFPIVYNGVSTETYGGTTFIINGAVGGSMSPTAFGVPGGGWAGNRVTSSLANLFPDLTGATDQRSLFWTNGQSETINSISTFTDGLAVTKWSNLNSDSTTPAGASTYCNTNFPMFRLAEQYLIYAEAVLRGGSGGSQGQAVAYVDSLRSRAAPGNTSYQPTSITLQDILNERGRELYWECFRRTDLIRYGLFTSQSYVWPWKGGIPGGTGVASYLNLFPLPSSDLSANSNLVQNPGYN
jgi:starch-binding outer membrane protein, SusD/RagB family